MGEWEHRCQFKSICSRISSVSGVAHRERTHKAGARMYARINRARSSKARKSHEPGPAFIRVSNHLALVCLFLGAAFAVFVSGSFAQRIGNLLIFGLMPAVGFYATGHVLGQLLILGVKFCDMLIVHCSRKVLLVAQDLLSWAGTRCLELMTEQSTRALESSARFRPPRTSRSNIQAHSITAQTAEVTGVSALDVHRIGWGLRSLIITSLFLIAGGFGWLAATASYWASDPQRLELSGAAAIHALVEQIIRVESNGDPNAKNRRSTATGLGQFLEETWLDMIRTHRPDLATGRNQAEILELRQDVKIVREITARFSERNAEVLKRRGLPVTPGTLYLAHFAGAAGAVAVLTAMEDADAALVLANADATGRTKREKLIKANPFLERFTVTDLRNWADRKMQVPRL
jgi:hypothetical protein